MDGSADPSTFIALTSDEFLRSAALSNRPLTRHDRGLELTYEEPRGPDTAREREGATYGCRPPFIIRTSLAGRAPTLDDERYLHVDLVERDVAVLVNVRLA